MKLYVRLLFTMPLVFITYIYISHHNPDEFCSGMMDIFFELVIMTCSLFALLAVFLKRKDKKTRAEPISLIIFYLQY